MARNKNRIGVNGITPWKLWTRNLEKKASITRQKALRCKILSKDAQLFFQRFRTPGDPVQRLDFQGWV